MDDPNSMKALTRSIDFSARTRALHTIRLMLSGSNLIKVCEHLDSTRKREVVRYRFSDRLKTVLANIRR
jgi:hypothetical protein